MAVADPLEIARHFTATNYVLVAGVRSCTPVLTLEPPETALPGPGADALSLAAYFSIDGQSAERAGVDAEDEPDVEMLESFSPIQF